MFGLPDLTESADLQTVVRWAIKGDHLDDLVLTVMGEAITACATGGTRSKHQTESGGVVIPLTRLLTQCASAARETSLGQFLTQVQGAKSMLRVRKGAKEAWKQEARMDAVAALMSGQVRSALDNGMWTNQKGETLEELPLRGKVVVKVLTPKGEERRLDLRPPEDGDWELLNLARHTKGERDAHVGTWSAFAMLVICCAQAEAGWFDLVRITSKMATRKRHKAAHGIVLSDSAHENIKRDIDKWLRMGFVKEPMLVEPESGDYLTVKHRRVAGGRGPMGAKTDPEGTTAWDVACEVMAGTAWSVPEGTLRALRDSPGVEALGEVCEPDGSRRASILASYRRHATDEFYIPIQIDFRGRVYTRSSVVTYQGRDLQKGLLCFPRPSRYREDAPSSSAIRATVLHCSALFGGPTKLDKGTFAERLEWWQSGEVGEARAAAIAGHWGNYHLEELLKAAEEPLQLLTALTLQAPGQGDRLACQIDGTCNGLQHLSALFRDETAAPFVNLTGSSLSTRPADIYGEVGARVLSRLEALSDPWARRLLCSVKIDRKLTKKPVMVLPYGGTRVTIEDAVLEAILDQKPNADEWLYGRTDHAMAARWDDWTDGKYEAFKDRDLKDHPLLHLDARRLGGLTWDSIVDILPRPMAAMQAFRDIAKAVGERTLEWSTGVGDHPLWVVQAKPKSSATPLHMKGLHLPGSVRGLLIRPGRDEIDGHAHVSGIVANFIHSQDAAHQTRTMMKFRAGGGRSFGAIFDCYLTRPSEMKLLSRCAREAFKEHYEADPLAHPVRMRNPKRTEEVEYFESWYALASFLGISFPERGTWEPKEVLDSAWFFS